jgi:hypothetical protein
LKSIQPKPKAAREEQSACWSFKNNLTAVKKAKLKSALRRLGYSFFSKK